MNFTVRKTKNLPSCYGELPTVLEIVSFLGAQWDHGYKPIPGITGFIWQHMMLSWHRVSQVT